MIIKNGIVFTEDGTFEEKELYIEGGRFVAGMDEVEDHLFVCNIHFEQRTERNCLAVYKSRYLQERQLPDFFIERQVVQQFNQFFMCHSFISVSLSVCR